MNATEFFSEPLLEPNSTSDSLQSETNSDTGYIDQTRAEINDPAGPYVSTIARIAIYDDMLSSPRIIDIEPAPLLRFIENIASETYDKARQLGGRLPYSTIREIAENFIHADFKECTVSVLDNGDTIRFSDRGPGIEKKLLVQQPGVTSASEQMRHYIKGVGSGFPLVREYLEINHGSLRIDDNAVEGVVITLSLVSSNSTNTVSSTQSAQGREPASLFSSSSIDTSQASSREELPIYPQQPVQPLANMVDPRTQAALEVIASLGAAGPTDLVVPLGISAATGTRLLDKLETAGLIEKASNRKRILSNNGLVYLQRLIGG
ncbi:MAG: ATP-binding protein [Coriobacteriia bacterium]|nr:ATP-binding protein [Coriobacteriia bacterium]